MEGHLKWRRQNLSYVHCDLARLHLLHKMCWVDSTLGSPNKQTFRQTDKQGLCIEDLNEMTRRIQIK